MANLSGLGDALTWVGRQGTRILALSLLTGIAVPPFGALLKPLVPEIIFVLLLFAILRVDPIALKRHVARPLLVLVAAGWTMIVLPAALCVAYRVIGMHEWAPDVMTALVLQAATSPIMSSAAIAALLGLDAALVLVAMVACTALVCVTAPLFVGLFIGSALVLSPLSLGLRLFGLLVSAAAVAAIVRWIVGSDRVTAEGSRIDGINVIAMSLFIVALMGDVGARLLSQPELVIGLTLLSFVLTFVLALPTIFVFAYAGRYQALSLGLFSSQRNMGLMLAVLGSVLPDMVWLYFALAQLPIYLMPQILKPFADRFRADRGSALGP